MCGIFLAIKSKQSSSELTTAKFAAIAEKYIRGRGPTYQESYSSEDIFAYQSILSIQTDNVRSNDRPSLGTNRFILYNGELYSANSITSSDTQQIIDAFDAKSLDSFLSNADGMYVIATLENKGCSGYNINIYRDPIGEKHCWFYHDDDIFILSSVPGAIAEYLSSIGRLEVNTEVLEDYMLRRHLISSYHHPIKNIYQVPVGKSTFNSIEWSFSPKNFSDHSFVLSYIDKMIDLDLRRTITSLDHKQFANLVHDKLRKTLFTMNNSVKDQSSISAIVSGGIDSSIVASTLFSQLESLSTFTLLFPEKDNVSSMASDMVADICRARNFKKNHLDILCNLENYMASLKEAVTILASPINTHSIPSSLLVAKFATNSSRILYGGEGADELFLGYSQYLNIIDQSLRTSPYNDKSSSLFSNLQAGFQDKIGIENNIFLFKESIKDLLLSKGFSLNEVLLKVESITDLFIQLQSVGLMSTDVINSSCGLECRSPFTRSNMISVALSAPLEKLISLGLNETKLPLTSIFKSDYSESYMKPKIGFAGYPNESVSALGNIEGWSVWNYFPEIYDHYSSMNRSEEWKIINIEWFLRQWT